MKKDLTYLNSKWWYRFIKVLFVLAILFTIAIYNLVVYSEEGFRRINQDKTTIQCLHKEKRSFSPASIDISISKYDLDNGKFDYKKYYEGYNDYSIKRILKSCYDKDVDDVYSMQKWYEMNLQDRTTITAAEMSQIQKIENAIISVKVQQLDYSFKFFDIKPVFTYGTGILLLLGNIVILFIWEILRRVFYYVVLGTFVPQRNNS